MKKNEKLFDLISKNLVVVVNFSFIIFIVFWLLFFITPKINGTKLDRTEIQKITEEIKQIKEYQYKLDSSISDFNLRIMNIDTSISKVKEKRTIIEKTIYEKSNIISTFNNDQIDSFLTDRYGYNIR